MAKTPIDWLYDSFENGCSYTDELAIKQRVQAMGGNAEAFMANGDLVIATESPPSAGIHLKVREEYHNEGAAEVGRRIRLRVTPTVEAFERSPEQSIRTHERAGELLGGLSSDGMKLLIGKDLRGSHQRSALEPTARTLESTLGLVADLSQMTPAHFAKMEQFYTNCALPTAQLEQNPRRPGHWIRAELSYGTSGPEPGLEPMMRVRLQGLASDKAGVCQECDWHLAYTVRDTGEVQGMALLSQRASRTSFTPIETPPGLKADSDLFKTGVLNLTQDLADLSSSLNPDAPHAMQLVITRGDPAVLVGAMAVVPEAMASLMTYTPVIPKFGGVLATEKSYTDFTGNLQALVTDNYLPSGPPKQYYGLPPAPGTTPSNTVTALCVAIRQQRETLLDKARQSHKRKSRTSKGAER